MAEFQILVPNGRTVGQVRGDGELATLLVAITPPESDYSIQTYSVQGAILPPRMITIEFDS